MASLVGTIGAPSLAGSANSAVTPAWGTGETRAIGNLLICWVDGMGAATLPSTPSGWSIAAQVAGTSCSATVFYRVATGSDAAPTIAATTSVFWAAQLAEYSGLAPSSPLDRNGTGTGTGNSITATCGGVDAAIGELVVAAGASYYNPSYPATKTISHTINNASDTETNNNGTSTYLHYDFTYGFTTANASATSDTYAETSTRLTGGAVALATFKLAPPTTSPVAEVALTAATPATKTAHSLHFRARVQTSVQATLRAALYEGTTNRSGDLETGNLTNALTEYTLAISDANAANIVDYTNLSIKFWGYSASGAIPVIEIAEAWLVIPAAAPVTVSGSASGTSDASMALTTGLSGTGVGTSAADLSGSLVAGATPISGSGVATSAASLTGSLIATSTATDNFNRADGGLGADWTSVTEGGLAIASQQVVGTNATTGPITGSIRTAETYTGDHSSQVEVAVSPGSAGWIGPAVRIQNSGADCYLGIYFNNAGTYEMRLYKRNSSTFTQLGTTYTCGLLAAGTLLKVEVVGTTITFYQDGVSRCSATDSSVASGGSPGIMATGNTAKVDNWTGSGSTSVTYPSFTYVSTDANGVKSYNLVSLTNGGGTHTIRVLEPTSPTPGVPHNIIYALPVVAELGTAYGDGMETLRGLNAHNQYNLTIVAPAFAIDPWYCDHATDSTLHHETFMVDELVPWVQANFCAGSEGHWLIGFSKSGIGGQDLLFRHPTVFAKAASWDAPFDMASYSDYGASGAYGTDANFQNNYRLSATFFTTYKAPFVTNHRIWIGGYSTAFPTEESYYDTVLTDQGILHTSETPTLRTHAWDTGWVPDALAALAIVPLALGVASSTSAAAAFVDTIAGLSSGVSVAAGFVDTLAGLAAGVSADSILVTAKTTMVPGVAASTSLANAFVDVLAGLGSGVSADSILITAKTTIPLDTAAGTSADAITITAIAGAAITPDVVAGISLASGLVQTRTQIPTSIGSGVSAASGYVSALLLVGVGTSVASAVVNRKEPVPVDVTTGTSTASAYVGDLYLASSAGTSAVASTVSVGTTVPMAVSAGVSLGIGVLIAPTFIPPNVAAGTSASSLVMVAGLTMLATGLSVGSITVNRKEPVPTDVSAGTSLGALQLSGGTQISGLATGLSVDSILVNRKEPVATAASAGVSLGIGSVSIGQVNVPLDVSAGTSLASGTVKAQVNVTGLTTGTSSASAQPNVPGGIGGITVGTSTAANTVKTTAPVPTAASAATSTASAGVTAAVVLAPSLAAGLSVAQASVLAAMPVSGLANATSFTVGVVPTVKMQLTGSVVGSSTAGAQVTTVTYVVASPATAVSVAVGELRKFFQLVPLDPASATSNASLTFFKRTPPLGHWQAGRPGHILVGAPGSFAATTPGHIS